MPARPRQLLRHLRRLAAPAEPDAVLLGRFVATRDEAAFAALVRRHGPMVLGACRRVLGHAQDAEDAFQATFLVLARKAAAVRPPGALAAWLHGVARRVSLKARAKRTRRQSAAPPLPPTATDVSLLDELSARELLAAVDEELQRLPAAYRLPLVLCCLEGRGQEEAARLLGWAPGSVKGRLERGRARLHARLARRGLVPAAAALLLWEVPSAPAALPAGLALAATRAAVSAPQPLAPGWLRGAATARRAAALAVVLTAGVLGAGAGALTRPPPDVPPAPAGPRPPRADRHGDPLPAGALQRLGTARLRHAGAGGFVAFLADGQTLLSVGPDGTVHFWEAATGRERRRCTPGAGGRDVAVTPDEKTLAVGCGGGIGLWDLATGKFLTGPLPTNEHTETRLAFSPDGRALVAAGTEPGARLWDWRAGKVLRRFTGPRAAATALALSGDGKALAVADRDGKLWVWDAASGELRHSADLIAGDPGALAASPDGKLLAAGKGREVVLLQAADGKPLRRLGGHALPPQALAFAPDGLTLAVAAGDRVHLWGVHSGQERRRLAAVWAGWLAFSRDGKSLATSGAGNRIRLWDATTGKELPDRGGHEGTVCSVCFSPDGKQVATAGREDQTVRLWDAATGAPASAPFRHETWVERVLFHPDGKRLFAGELRGEVVEWDLAGGERRLRPELRPGTSKYANDLRGLALAPDGTALTALVLTRSGTGGRRSLFTWGLGAGGRRAERGGPAGGGQEALSPDGALLAVGDGPTVRVGETAGGKPRVALHGQCSAVVPLAFAPDGRVLAGVCVRYSPDLRDTRVRYTLALWELTTGQELHRRELPGRVFSLAFGPGGRVLATAGEAGVPIQLWDVASGKELQRLTGHGADVMALAFAPDGGRLASGLRDTTALVWDTSAAPPRARPRLTPEEAEALWATLAERDAARAYAALARLAESPEQAVALLGRRLRPAAAVEPRRVARLIADLDGNDFARREAAGRELEAVREQAQAALRLALADRPSAEARKRLQALLADPGVVRSPEVVRQVRAVGVLERVGSPAARRALEALAAGAPAARLTQEASASLARLRRPEAPAGK